MHPDQRFNVYRGIGFAIGLLLLVAALWGAWQQQDIGGIPEAETGATTTTVPDTAPAGTAAGTPASIPGESGVEQVKAVQQRLHDLGYDTGPADGAAGPKLAAALVAFQDANGLPATGELNAETIARLNSAEALRAVPSKST